MGGTGVRARYRADAVHCYLFDLLLGVLCWMMAVTPRDRSVGSGFGWRMDTAVRMWLTATTGRTCFTTYLYLYATYADFLHTFIYLPLSPTTASELSLLTILCSSTFTRCGFLPLRTHLCLRRPFLVWNVLYSITALPVLPWNIHLVSSCLPSLL